MLKLKGCETRVSVHLCLRQADNILYIKRQNTGYHDGEWSLPAGTLEKNESVIDAIIREAFEELRIYIKPSDINIAHVLHRKGDDCSRIDYFFITEQWSGIVENGEPDKCSIMEWYNLYNRPIPLLYFLNEAIDNIINKIPFSIVGWATSKHEEK